MRAWDSVVFWSHVDKSGDCWLWTAYRNRGYGKIMLEGRCRMAHRVAWEQEFGLIPEGLALCHHCDNPSCVRPSHMFIGTQQDNLDDMVSKGRHLVGKKQAGDKMRGVKRPHFCPAGEKNGRAKLLDCQRAQIRFLYGLGNYTRRELADAYGVSVSTIGVTTR